MTEHFGGRPGPGGNTPQCALEGKCATERARYAYRAAAVRAQSRRNHARRDGNGRTGAGAAAGEARGPRVASVAEHPRRTGARPAELGGRGLAKNDRASVFEATDDGCVLNRHRLQRSQRPPRGAQPGSGKEILDAKGYAVQRTAYLTALQFGCHACGLFKRGLGIHITECIQCGIVGFNRCKA